MKKLQNFTSQMAIYEVKKLQNWPYVMVIKFHQKNELEIIFDVHKLDHKGSLFA